MYNRIFFWFSKLCVHISSCNVLMNSWSPCLGYNFALENCYVLDYETTVDIRVSNMIAKFCGLSDFLVGVGAEEVVVGICTGK